MAEKQNDQKTIPPYLAYRTFRNFLDSLQAGIPGRIDRSVMPTLSGANQSWLLGTLRYLGLISPHGVPSEKLSKLVKAQGAERQKLLQDLLKSSYAFLFEDGFDLRTATPRQIEERFTSVGASGETVRKCVAFFLSLSKDADLQLSPYLGQMRGRGVGQRARRNAQAQPGSRAREEEPRRTDAGAGPANRYQVLLDILDPNAMEEDEQKAVWTLIRYLKRKEGTA